jgi:hypothetical protein
MAVIAAPKFKRGVAFCGTAGPVDGVADGQTCHRLPMHHGEHNAFVRGNGVAKKVAPKRAAKRLVIRTVNGAKYRQSVAKSGVITLTPVTPPAVEAAPAPTKTASSAKKPAARPAKKVVIRKPRVQVIPEAKSRRRVASSTGR